MMYTALSEFIDAEACLQAASDDPGSAGKARYGLAVLYQLRATEYIREENYGLREKCLNRATEYAKAALACDPLEVGLVHNQLGYIYKDLAQRYQLTGNGQNASDALEKARTHFQIALKLDHNDANAHNGMGSTYMIQGDFDQAIKSCERAVAVIPEYLFAHYDLAQAYYFKAENAQGQQTQRSLLTKGLVAYKRVMEIELEGHQRLPDHAREALSALYNPLVERLKDTRQ